MEKTNLKPEQLLVNALSHYQQSEKKKTQANWLYSDEETINIALQAIEDGADLKGKLDNPLGGELPYLQIATDKQMWSVAMKMIDKGANVNAEDWHGYNCFHNLFFHFYYFEVCKDKDAARAVMVKMLQHGATTNSIARIVQKDKVGKNLLEELIKEAQAQK